MSDRNTPDNPVEVFYAHARLCPACNRHHGLCWTGGNLLDVAVSWAVNCFTKSPIPISSRRRYADL